MSNRSIIYNQSAINTIDVSAFVKDGTPFDARQTGRDNFTHTRHEKFPPRTFASAGFQRVLSDAEFLLWEVRMGVLNFRQSYFLTRALSDGASEL